MTIAEKFYILTDKKNEIGIEVVETESEWNTTHYEFVIYIKEDFFRYLESVGKTREWEEEGVAAVMDCANIFVADSLEAAIEMMFEHYDRAGELL